MVLVSHWRYLFFHDFPTLPHPSALIKVAYLLSGLGHQAVMVFFVLSGYLIGSSAVRSIQQGRWSWKQYLVNRMTRLWTVLIPALFAGLLFDYLGTHLYGNSGVYSGVEKAMLPVPVASQITVPIFVGNLLFLQNILVGTFGSNGPLWSLANEFWYYICFPFLVLALRDGSSIRHRVANAIPAILILAFVGTSIRVGFLVWLMGAALSLTSGLKDRYRLPEALRRTSAAVGVVLVLALACIVRISSLNAYFADLSLGACCAILLFLLLQSDALIGKQSLYASVFRRAALGSYSLYLVHVPFLVLLQSALINEQRWSPDGRHFMYAFAVLLATLGYAALMYGLFERRTKRIRNFVSEMLTERSPLGRLAFTPKSDRAPAD